MNTLAPQGIKIHTDYADWSFNKRQTMQHELLNSLELKIDAVRTQLESAAKSKKNAFDTLYSRLLSVRKRKDQVKTDYIGIKHREQTLRVSLEQLSAAAAAAKRNVLSQQNQQPPTRPENKPSSSSTTATPPPHQVICTGVCLKRGTYLQHKWRTRWVELTTTSLRYFCSEFDSVRRDAFPRGLILIKHLTECTLGESKIIHNRVQQTFLVRGTLVNGSPVEFMLATEEPSAIRWVSRIHRVMSRTKFQTTSHHPPAHHPSTSTSTSTSTTTTTPIDSNAQNARRVKSETDLHMRREERDGCQEELLLLLQQRENVASNLRDLKGIESALLGPLLLQSRYNLTPPPPLPQPHHSHHVQGNNTNRIVGRGRRRNRGGGYRETKYNSNGSANSHGSTNSHGSHDSKTSKTSASSSNGNGRATFRFATELFTPKNKSSKHNRKNPNININSTNSKSAKNNTNNNAPTMLHFHHHHNNNSFLNASSSSSKHVSNQAIWEEGTGFFLGQEPTKNPSDFESSTVTKLNEAIRKLLTVGESINASETEEDRNVIRQVLNADLKKKQLWRVLERLVVERENTKRRLDRLTQRSARFEDTALLTTQSRGGNGSYTTSTTRSSTSTATTGSPRNISTDSFSTVGDLFEINLDS